MKKLLLFLSIILLSLACVLLNGEISHLKSKINDSNNRIEKLENPCPFQQGDTVLIHTRHSYHYPYVISRITWDNKRQWIYLLYSYVNNDIIETTYIIPYKQVNYEKVNPTSNYLLKSK